MRSWPQADCSVSGRLGVIRENFSPTIASAPPHVEKNPPGSRRCAPAGSSRGTTKPASWRSPRPSGTGRRPTLATGVVAMRRRDPLQAISKGKQRETRQGSQQTPAPLGPLSDRAETLIIIVAPAVAKRELCLLVFSSQTCFNSLATHSVGGFHSTSINRVDEGYRWPVTCFGALLGSSVSCW